mmetsp:Transcript_17214/g.33571  ORF Transcript_17214/g.33571 Transcript_17214/m.33571 type:complete len:96 (-) Transcript_17214:921-1208(-)
MKPRPQLSIELCSHSCIPLPIIRIKRKLQRLRALRRRHASHCKAWLIDRKWFGDVSARSPGPMLLRVCLAPRLTRPTCRANPETPSRARARHPGE